MKSMDGVIAFVISGLLKGIGVLMVLLALLFVTGGVEVGPNLNLTYKEAALGCILISIYLRLLSMKGAIL